MSTWDELSWLFFGWVGILLGAMIGSAGPSTFGGLIALITVVLVHLFFAIRVEMVFCRYRKLLKEVQNGNAG